MKLSFSTVNELTRQAFDNESKFQNFASIVVDVCRKGDKDYSVSEANQRIHAKMCQIAGLSEKPTAAEVRRALKKTSVREAIFEIIETTIEDTLVTGWGTDPFFMKYVEIKMGRNGDKNVFYTPDETLITMAKINNGHHDMVRQRLGAGKEISVVTQSYGAKVYMETSRYLQGVEDWTALIGKLSQALTRLVNTVVHESFTTAGESLPSSEQWNVKGELSTTNHDAFVKLISDVELASGSPAVIIGTKVALARLHNMGDVAWASDLAKDDIYLMGRLGTFEGTEIAELPQAFAVNDTSRYLEDDTKIYIVPSNIGQFIKMFYEGDTEITEVVDSSVRQDKTRDYELQTTFGVATMISTRFGTWTIE